MKPLNLNKPVLVTIEDEEVNAVIPAGDDKADSVKAALYGHFDAEVEITGWAIKAHNPLTIYVQYTNLDNCEEDLEAILKQVWMY